VFSILAAARDLKRDWFLYFIKEDLKKTYSKWKN
jgi:hypothetical protein